MDTREAVDRIMSLVKLTDAERQQPLAEGVEILEAWYEERIHAEAMEAEDLGTEAVPSQEGPSADCDIVKDALDAYDAELEYRYADFANEHNFKLLRATLALSRLRAALASERAKRDREPCAHCGPPAWEGYSPASDATALRDAVANAVHSFLKSTGLDFDGSDYCRESLADVIGAALPRSEPREEGQG